MNRCCSIISAVLLLLIAISGIAAAGNEIRGTVAHGDCTWDPQSFAGFYYDIDQDLGRESISVSLSGGDELSGKEPYGIKYRTVAQAKSFKFQDWGAFRVMGFLGEEYLAGYVLDKSIPEENQIPYSKSGEPDSLYNSQLEKVLIDDDSEMTVTAGTPLTLDDGYVLAIKSIDIDGNKLFLDLTKDGIVVDSIAISPSKDGATLLDKTYFYKKPTVGKQDDLVTIAVHFKNAFRGADQDLATVEGIWQVSETPVSLSRESSFGLMKVDGMSSGGGFLSLANKGNSISLRKGESVEIMPGMEIETLNGDELSFFLKRRLTQPGAYELRSSVAAGDHVWTSQDFPEFFFDPNKDLGSEYLTVAISDGNILGGEPPFGLTYATIAQETRFAHEGWGRYDAIGFLGRKCLVGYYLTDDLPKDDQVIYWNSSEKNPLESGQLQEVLLDDSCEKVVKKGSSLKLAEGYDLRVNGVSDDGRCFLELRKNGTGVDFKILSPNRDAATMADKTYLYKVDAGKLKDFVIIAAHIKEAYKNGYEAAVTFDGTWQVSSNSKDISRGSKHEKMTVDDIGRSNLVMVNRDSQIRLSKNKDISLFGDLRLKTADNDTLRYYIYRTLVIE